MFNSLNHIAEETAMATRILSLTLMVSFLLCLSSTTQAGGHIDPAGFTDDALCRPESRARFRQLMYLGLTDAFRAFNSGPHLYSYWDYQRGAWAKANGLLIGHLLLSPGAADRLKAAGIDKTPRAKEKPSDHTPVWCELD